MDVIAELKDPAMRMMEYKKLVERAKGDGDKYNIFGAIINWIDIFLSLHIEITQKNAEELRDAYIYACS
jgi:DNA-binding transcriptional regulator GbsR (MarR family)